MKKFASAMASVLALGFLIYLAAEAAWRIWGPSDHDPLVPILGIVMILIWSTVVQYCISIVSSINVILSWVMIQRYRENPDQFVPSLPPEQRADLN